MRLDGREILITGAAGGVGHALVDRLAGSAARLVLTDRRGDALDELADRAGARAIAADLCEPADLDALVADCRPDVLIANAGVPATGRLTELSGAEVERALAVNFIAPVRLARGLARGMVERGAGHLVFLSSVAGKAASGRASLYCGTKFGLRGFALALRQELRPSGVGVSLVLPGPIRDVGMFAAAGVRLPRGVRGRTAAQVADAVVRAVERNRSEVTVAPLALRAACWGATVAPGVAGWLGSRGRADQLAAAIADGQRGKW